MPSWCVCPTQEAGPSRPEGPPGTAGAVWGWSLRAPEDGPLSPRRPRPRPQLPLAPRRCQADFAPGVTTPPRAPDRRGLAHHFCWGAAVCRNGAGVKGTIWPRGEALWAPSDAGTARAPPPGRPPRPGSLGLLPITLDPLAVLEGPGKGVWLLSSRTPPRLAGPDGPFLSRFCLRKRHMQ